MVHQIKVLHCIVLCETFFRVERAREGPRREGQDVAG